MSGFAFEQVGKSFPGPGGRRVEALRDFTLTGRAGEFLVLLGASGSGKTTALRLLAGLETVDHGRLTLDGQPAEKTPARDRDGAMVFQHPALYPHLTVEANLRLGLEIRRVPAEEIRRRVGEAVGLLGLRELTGRKPATLSGGQMQRVALARAVARRPKLLLLDEPLANLDGPARSELKERIREIQSAAGITTVLVTHDQAEAFSLGQRIAVVEAGRVLQVDTPAALYRNPATLAVAQFLARPQLNVLPGMVLIDGTGVWFEVKPSGGGPVPRLRLPSDSGPSLATLKDRPLLLVIRPEQVWFEPAAFHGEPAGGPKAPKVTPFDVGSTAPGLKARNVTAWGEAPGTTPPNPASPVRAEPSPPPVPVGGKNRVLDAVQRLEAAESSSAPPPGARPAIELEARSLRIEPLGGWIDVHFDLAGHRLVMRTTAGRMPDEPPARLALDFTGALFFDPATGARLGGDG